MPHRLSGPLLIFLAAMTHPAAAQFANTPHGGLPAANVSPATFRPDGTISNLGGFGSITGTDGSHLTRSGMDERTFRFGLRLSF